MSFLTRKIVQLFRNVGLQATKSPLKTLCNFFNKNFKKYIIIIIISTNLSANSCRMMSATFPLSSCSRLATLSIPSTSSSFCFNMLFKRAFSPSTSDKRACNKTSTCAMIGNLNKLNNNWNIKIKKIGKSPFVNN